MSQSDRTGFCPEDQQLQDCSIYSLMKKNDALLVESSFLFGELQQDCRMDGVETCNLTPYWLIRGA
jgi:hypothetical protein